MSTAIAAPPVPEAVDARLHRLRHVFPVAGWLSAVIQTTPGLVRYYRLQETGGTNATDSASGSTGTYQGSPTLARAGLWTPDDATIYSVDLNGSSQYVTVPTLDFVTACKSFSVEAVIRSDSLAAVRCIVAARTADALGQVWYLDVQTTGALRFGFWTSDLSSAAGVISTATTYHVCATYDGATDTSSIYVNGVSAATPSNVGPVTSGTTPTIEIGRYPSPGNYFDGRISDVAIFSRALTSAEVLAHAEAAGLASTSSSNGALVARSSTLVLGKPMKAVALPIGYEPGSADLVAGSYTHRLNDAGEFSLTFPNREASDGIPWRERFDTAGHLEFIEHYRDDVLEFVGSVQRVQVDRQQVTVSGPDAMGLLRKAYEGDQTWTAAPADVIDAYTRVPVVLVADEFSDGTLSPWSHVVPSGTASVAVSNGVLTMTSTSAGSTAYANLDLPKFGGALSDSWDMDIVIRSATLTGTSALLIRVETPGNTTTTSYVRIGYLLSSGQLTIQSSTGASTTDAGIAGPPVYPLTLSLRRRGRWIYGYANGRAIGSVGYTVSTSTALGRIRIECNGFANGDTISVESVILRDRQPFLRRGSTDHDRYLPGDYPSSGLRGRYWSDTDLQAASDRSTKILAPTRPSRDERLDITPSTSYITIPASGATDYVSVRWFGAVYLRGDLGDYGFRVATTVGGVRVWVAKTGWGDQLLDDWSVAGSRTVGPQTLDSTLFGDRAAWVPIVVEFHDDANTQTLDLQFSPPGVGSYTDPGGNTVTRGSYATIPSTSLSPLGCYDNRVQGASHFDLVQQAAAPFGLSLWCEPMQLESGEFPGRLLAKARFGRDTDVILQGEDVTPPEPLIGPSVETDAADLATTVRGGGAGAASGSAVIGEVFDASSASAALFDLQAYVDAGDITIRDLLGARLDAELALRLSPWQNVTGTPRAQERLADTFPLTRVYSAMRWRPGDAVRLWLPEVGVADYTPRQIIQVTREFQPDGRTGTSVGFRQRPKAIGATLRRLTRAALAPQRTYQRQKVTVTGYAADASVGAGAYGSYVKIPLQQGDLVLRAVARIAVNSAASPSTGIEINGSDRTSALGGNWTLQPVEIDITAYASPASTTDNRLYVRLKNNAAGAATLEFGVMVEVLR